MTSHDQRGLEPGTQPGLEGAEKSAEHLGFGAAILKLMQRFCDNQPTFSHTLTRNLGLRDNQTLRKRTLLSIQELERRAEEERRSAKTARDAHNTTQWLNLYGGIKEVPENKKRWDVTRKKTFYFTGEETEAIKESLDLKSGEAAWQNNEKGFGKNSYHRLRDDIGSQVRDQLGKPELVVNTNYEIRLGWHKKRKLRRALRYIQTDQSFIAHKETVHESKNLHKHEFLTLTPYEIEVIRACEKRRLARLALTADEILTKLGYLRPADNIKIFKLENLILLGLE